MVKEDMTMEYYQAREKGILSFEIAWVGLEYITLSEIIQTEKTNTV